MGEDAVLVLSSDSTETLSSVTDFVGPRLWKGFAGKKVVENREIFECPVNFFEERGAILNYVADHVLR